MPQLQVRQQRLSARFPLQASWFFYWLRPSSKCPERPRKALNLSPKPVPKQTVSDDFAALRLTTSFGGLHFALQLAPASNSAQMLRCSTKYGRLVRLIVSATSWSAAWTRSRRPAA